MVGQRHLVENVFFLSLGTFLAAKLLNWPTIYPVIGLLAFLLYGNLFQSLLQKKWAVALWVGLALYAYFVLPPFLNAPVAAAFLVTPLYAFCITSLIIKYPLDRQYLLSGIFWISLLLTCSALLGVVLHLDEIRPFLTLDHFLFELQRRDATLRQFFFNALIPWEETQDGQLAVVSLLGLLLITLSLLKPTGKMGWAAAALLLSLNLLAMARGPIIIAIGLMMITTFVQSRRKMIWAIATMASFPLLFFNLTARFLNGRKPIWDTLINNLDWRGHGIGAAAESAKAASLGYNQKPVINYPHNVHLELIYDWGLLPYGLFAAVTLVYLFKYKKVRTAFLLLFVLSLTYTIYSPWTFWLLLFAVWQDREAFALLNHKLGHLRRQELFAMEPIVGQRANDAKNITDGVAQVTDLGFIDLRREQNQRDHQHLSETAP